MATYSGSDKRLKYLFDASRNLASDYSSSSTYAVGDYAMYQGVLKKCVTAVSTPEAFDSTKWENALVTDNMGGGGGTTVIANPQGEPTDDLETIQIGSTIYDIVGGGAKTEEEKVLVGSTVTATGSGSASTSVDKSNVIKVKLELWLWCPDVTQDGTVYIVVNNQNYLVTDYTYYTYTDQYHAVRTYLLELNGVDVTQIGYSFSGLAYNSASQFHGEITLTWQEQPFPELVQLSDVDVNNLQDGQIIKWNATTQKFENANESGGVDVEANPSEPATEELSTIKIDNTVYSIPTGGIAEIYPVDTNEHEIGDNLFVRRFYGSSLASGSVTVLNNLHGTVLNAYGWVKSTTTGYTGNIYNFNSYVDGDWKALAYQDGTNVIIANGANLRGEYSLWIIYSKSTDAAIDRVYNNGTSGSSSYTITEDGLYLIIASYSHNGSASITLPSGRTAILSSTVVSGARGMKWCLVELQTNDIVTMSATASSWISFSKSIYKLSNMNFGSSSSINGSRAVNDGTATLSPPNDSKKALIFGIAEGRTSSNISNSTNKTGKVIDAQYESTIGVNTLVALYYGTASALPTISLYGYDGGGAYESCILET